MLWNPDAAGAWSLLFTPVFGSILVRKNWKAIGDEDKVRQGAIWLGASIVMLLATIFIGILGFFYIIVWYFAWQRPQAQFIRERWGKDYPRKGWIVPLLAALGIYIAVVVVLTMVIMALGPPLTR
jgi:heme/copper-type cytochrome/quinol oxidase subunit 2